MTASVVGYCGPLVDVGIATVLDLVDRRMVTAPEAPAIVHKGIKISYEQLNVLADRVSYRLQHDHGVGRGDVVMIAATAGIDYTAIVVGTMRTGAGYLPVDVSYPADRLDYISRASRAKVTVRTTADPADTAALIAGDLVAPLPAGLAPIERPAIEPGDTAYMIFTSGSTGHPKGIVQTHRCLANFIPWQVAASGLGQQRRVLQCAPLSFDVSVQEMWYTLGSGGCLYVPSAEVRRDPRDLVRFIIDNDIEVVDFPQSMIDAIMTLPVSFADATALRHIISAGETVRISPALRGLLLARPELRLHNHYGPAENNMVTAHVMGAELGNLEPRPPVGSLVWNTYIYVLDDDGRPVPDGDVGEVYIGGPGVGTGYTDPDLTAAVFLDDPFRPGERIYRTRDRARWRPDDTLELLGRLDDLIKIRGFSVEPREVEEQLRLIDGIIACAVYGVERPDGAVELHAAVTGEPPAIPDLRRHLLAVLPDYMVPVRWWRVDDLPISPNGKLDRRRLPDPVRHRSPWRSARPPAELTEEVRQPRRQLIGVVGEYRLLRSAHDAGEVAAITGGRGGREDGDRTDVGDRVRLPRCRQKPQPCAVAGHQIVGRVGGSRSAARLDQVITAQ